MDETLVQEKTIINRPLLARSCPSNYEKTFSKADSGGIQDCLFLECFIWLQYKLPFIALSLPSVDYVFRRQNYSRKIWTGNEVILARALLLPLSMCPASMQDSLLPHPIKVGGFYCCYTATFANGTKQSLCIANYF
jgi:hypothetical protein